MKHLFFLAMLALPMTAFSQASVAYYPFNNQFTVSSNPNKPVWVDARLQTNTPFSLATTVCPMVNIARKEQVNYYVGPGLRVNALNTFNKAKLIEGYSFHVGARITPVRNVPNLGVAVELAPLVYSSLQFGYVQSFLGVVWHFKKKE